MIKGWRVVRMTKTAAGADAMETISRTFASRETALVYAQFAGDGAFIKVVTAHVDDVEAQLC